MEKFRSMNRSLVNTEAMTAEQLRAELLAGFEEMQAEKVQDASIAFEKFREAHKGDSQGTGVPGVRLCRRNG